MGECKKLAPMIYLDHNASMPLSPGAVAAMQDFYSWQGNTASVHAVGQKAQYHLRDFRLRLRRALHIPQDRHIIFTSGATEANGLVHHSFLPYQCFATRHEHASNYPVTHTYHPLPFHTCGGVDMAHCKKLAFTPSKTSFLVATYSAHSVTGICQPLQDIATHIQTQGGYLLVDGAQSLGKDTTFSLKVGDFISLSAHKIGGPVGIGALVVSSRGKNMLQPLYAGGGQEYGMRSGTTSLMLIAGFVAAVEQALPTDIWTKWQQDLEQTVTQAGGKIVGSDVPRLPNTSCIIMPGVSAQEQLMYFDAMGITVGVGSACSNGQALAILEDMGYTPKEASQAIRVSMGRTTTVTEVKQFCQTWQNLYTMHKGI